MKNTKIYGIALCALLLAAPFLGAEEAAPATEKNPETPAQESAAPEVSDQELHEMLGYLTAIKGGVSSLKLNEAEIKEMAGGLHKALTGEVSVPSPADDEVKAAFAEAQARAEAVQASSEELPPFSEGALGTIGVVISKQSGVQHLGIDAENADAVRDGFIEGSSATTVDPSMRAKMPAFQAFIKSRMEEAQAAIAAEQEKARKAAMAEFESVADEWSQKENINVVLETTQGEIEIELYPKEAPLAVANFVGHIKDDYYDGLIFHRVIEGFMIQGGDPLGTGTGGESIWGKPFPDEFTEELRFDEKGLLAMANSGPMTNGSQFFITTGEPNWLNDKHTIFGKVVSGYENVEKIETTETGDRDKPVEDQKIVEAYVKD